MRPQTPDREEEASLARGRGRTMRPCFRCEYLLNQLICCQSLRAKRQKSGVCQRCRRESVCWCFGVSALVVLRISCNLNLRIICRSDLRLPFREGMRGCRRLKEWVAIAFVYLCESCKGSFKTAHENKMHQRLVFWGKGGFKATGHWKNNYSPLCHSKPVLLMTGRIYKERINKV